MQYADPFNKKLSDFLDVILGLFFFPLSTAAGSGTSLNGVVTDVSTIINTTIVVQVDKSTSVVTINFMNTSRTFAWRRRHHIYI